MPGHDRLGRTHAHRHAAETRHGCRHGPSTDARICRCRSLIYRYSSSLNGGRQSRTCACEHAVVMSNSRLLGGRIAEAVDRLRLRGIAVDATMRAGVTTYLVERPTYRARIVVDPVRWLGVEFVLLGADRLDNQRVVDLGYWADTDLYNISLDKYQAVCRGDRDRHRSAAGRAGTGHGVCGPYLATHLDDRAVQRRSSADPPATIRCDQGLVRRRRDLGTAAGLPAPGPVASCPVGGASRQRAASGSAADRALAPKRVRRGHPAVSASRRSMNGIMSPSRTYLSIST